VAIKGVERLLSCSTPSFNKEIANGNLLVDSGAGALDWHANIACFSGVARCPMGRSHVRV